MKNRIRSQGYLLFSLLSAFLVILLAIVIILFAVMGTKEKNENFPEYTYAEYIDRSERMIFTQGGGAQLYEAEAASLTGTGKVVENIVASSGQAVSNLSNYSSMNYTIASDENTKARMFVSVNYTSEYARDIVAEVLFALFVNEKKIDTGASTVKHCYSAYDFKENYLCEIDLMKGNNVLQLISYSSFYQIDYLVLVSPCERTDSDAVIGLTYYPFIFYDNRQIFEAEKAERKNAVVTNSTMASRGYYTLHSQDGDDVIFHIEADRDYDTDLALCLKKASVNGTQGNFYITVNRKEIKASSEFEMNGNKFEEAEIGSIHLNKGKNEIVVGRKNGVFLLDYIVLNSSINYSFSEETQKYEAEHALLTDSQIGLSDLASNGRYVEPLSQNAKMIFTIRSLVAEENYLSLRMSCFAGETVSAVKDLICFSLNRQKLNLDSLEIQNSSSKLYFLNILIGRMMIQSGENTIEIEVKNPLFYLDSLTLSKSVYSSDVHYQKYEAENAYLFGDCGTEWNEEASGNKNIGYIREGSSILFTLICSENLQRGMRICLSNYLTKNEELSKYCLIRVNERIIDLSNRLMLATKSWTSFTECEAGFVQLKEGLNTITIECKISSSYNVDYICLYS